MKFFLLKNVKMPLLVGILTFIGRKMVFYAFLSLENGELLDSFILMNISKFKLSINKLITSGPGLQSSHCERNVCEHDINAVFNNKNNQLLQLCTARTVFSILVTVRLYTVMPWGVAA